MLTFAVFPSESESQAMPAASFFTYTDLPPIGHPLEWQEIKSLDLVFRVAF